MVKNRINVYEKSYLAVKNLFKDRYNFFVLKRAGINVDTDCLLRTCSTS